MRLRKFLFVLLICLVQPVSGNAAWTSNGSTQNVSVANNAVMNFPDGDFTLAGWVQVTNNAGTDYSDIFRYRNGPRVVLRLYQTSSNFNASSLNFYINDGTDGAAPEVDNNAFLSNTAWTHVAFIRASNVFTLYVNGSSVESSAAGSVDGVTLTDPMTFFGAGAPFLNGAMAEWAKWDRALNAAELAGLVGGYAPNCFPIAVLYTPMIAVYQELMHGLTVTNNGTTQAAHPRIIYCGE